MGDWVCARPFVTLFTDMGETADELLCGQGCRIVKRGKSAEIITDYGYRGWVDPAALCRRTAACDLTVRTAWCDVAESPSVQARRLIALPRGAGLTALAAAENDFRWVRLPDGQCGFVRAEAVQSPSTSTFADAAALREALVAAALSYLGTPYRWGGRTPQGIDCSGLCFCAYVLCGITIWRDAAIVDGYPIRPIPFEQAQRGDLLYFRGHVAMYLGGDNFVHATAHRGVNAVTVNSFCPDSPLYRADLREGLLTAGTCL